MKFFNKGKEYWKHANNSANLYGLINNVLDDFKGKSDTELIKNKMVAFIIGCLFYEHVSLKIQKYEWSFTIPIQIPNISEDTITLQEAYSSVLRNLFELICTEEDQVVLENILEGGKYYNEFKEMVPAHLQKFE